MRRAFLVVVAFVLSGCAAGKWNKPGATGEDFADDQLKCEAHVSMACAQAHEYAGMCRAVQFRNCMNARGWKLE